MDSYLFIFIHLCARVRKLQAKTRGRHAEDTRKTPVLHRRDAINPADPMIPMGDMVPIDSRIPKIVESLQKLLHLWQDVRRVVHL